MDDEKRRAARYRATVAAEVDLDGETVQGALTRDASEHGVSLLTEHALPVGREVTLRCTLEHTAVSVVGKVVRVRELPAEDSSRWALEIAIELTAPNPLVGEIFRQLGRMKD
jgi:hypothetical protein